ncbi:hypothetical protein SERLA73DRAFT_99710 [Serpula lacrymans var. lacrymans S7.3]|uniref:SP-RING-type domain-containing protein n=2 Tax=Serpula lacrymans var. lacrymans TaxID=341189 RepID=F8QHU4_SERL3|nr:uncharacterized protein SERLADRAFT_450290 [Serpula lacrymans var. lacrymans S7.9]EGN92140.1 hypothetical protein SERLA73DRAFT_99710 [Serpula lacrymans var. lacrymans S7.3]EGO23993.1 hypothetical protein SERLADRAFT_450290 [Serpula lacrymans var. lacrymans S7.9]
MPTASSSRLKSSARSRRVPSSDGIEEDGLSQQPTQDDVDEGGSSSEEEQQPRRKSVKKEKNAKKRGPQVEDDNEDDDRIDVRNFRDQPLDRKDGAKLHGIAQDWEMTRKQAHQGSFGLVNDVAISLADVMDGDQAEEALAEVDIIMRDLLDIEQEMISHEETLDGIYQRLSQGEAIEGVLDMYEKGVKTQLNDFRKKTSRQKYSKNERYTKFKQGVYEVQHPGEAIPPINEFIPKEDADDSDDDDDLEVGGMTQDYKCPITLTILINPVTSQICGHSFSANAIREFLGNTRKAKKCPASGCNKEISLGDLKPDKELEKKVKIAARRLRREEDDSDEDVDEVIE